MRLLLLLIGFFFVPFLVAQKIRVSNVNPDFKKVRTIEEFYCLHDDFPDNDVDFVADFTITFDTIVHKSILSYYNLLMEKAQRMGANTFRVAESDIYSEGTGKFITISCYFLKMEDFKRNRNMFYSTDVHLFGYLGYHQNIEGYKVSYNGFEFVLYELRYKTFKAKEGDQVLVKLGGGVRGAQFSFSVDAEMVPRYIYFEMVSGTFYNCLIAEYDYTFGEFLKGILQSE